VRETVLSIKQQVSSWATAVDASAAHYAASARPGAVAAAIAGCVALGGGATYCAKQGLPTRFPFVSGKDAQTVKPPGRAATPKQRRVAPRARVPAPASEPRTTPAAQRPAASHRGIRRPPERRRSPRDRAVAEELLVAPAGDEFGFERRSPTASQSTQPASPAPPPAAPAEFDP
jgi:hypothetical protein